MLRNRQNRGTRLPAKSLALFSSLITGVACAQPLSYFKNFYLKGGGGLIAVELPKVNGYATSVSDGAGSVVRQQLDNGHQIEDSDILGHLGIGVALQKPTTNFAEVRMQIEGIHATVDDGKTRAETLGAGQFLDILPVDASRDNNLASPGIIALGGQTVTTAVEAEAELTEIKWSSEGDFVPSDFGSAGKVFPQVSAGLILTQLDQDYQITQTVAGFAQNHRLNQELDAFYIGPFVGAGLAYHPIDPLKFTVGGEIAALFVDAELDAGQNAVLGGLAPFSAQRSDEDSDVSGRASAKVGMEYDFGIFRIGAAGQFTYWSYVPELVNPNLAVGANVLSAATTVRPANIGDDDMMTYEATLNATVPF